MQRPSGLVFHGWVLASSSQLLERLSIEGGFSCSDTALEVRPSTLSVGIETLLAVRTCIANCLTSTTLMQENQFVPNITGTKYFATDIKPNEVHCKLETYTYLQTCTHCGIQHAGDSITFTE